MCDGCQTAKSYQKMSENIFFLGFFLGFFIGLLLAFIACRSDLYISWGDRLTEAQERALHRLGFKI